jgi:Na+/proline symporter
MSILDWTVLFITLAGISIYGIYRGRKSRGLDGFLRAGQSLPWYHVGLSVMATQASAITFLAGPGFGYAHGLGFIQFYLGLPLAVLVLCISFVPNFYRLNVYTAYEYLEGRFDPKTRTLTAILFLILRALSTSISVYAPSLILSALLHIPSYFSTLVVGILVVTYTLIGGSKAVSYTQVLQMFIIFTGLFTAIFITFWLLPPKVHLQQALEISGMMGHLKAMDFRWDLKERYNIWSGLMGGFFLQLSYFGTDQSQVSRYLTGSSIRESKLGLILNGLIKIPMQFLILMTGVLIFTFYQFHEPPIAFNPLIKSGIQSPAKLKSFTILEGQYHKVFADKKSNLENYLTPPTELKNRYLPELKKNIQAQYSSMQNLEKKASGFKDAQTQKSSDDSNYVFLSFILKYLPHGLIGALIAIIFLSSMGAVSSALNSMASTSLVDIYRRWFDPGRKETFYLFLSRGFTLFWGLICILLALFIGEFENLIEAVNIIGSFVYGPILGVFLVAFYLKWVRGNSVFYAGILGEVMVLLASKYLNIAYLWLNVVGSISVVVIALILESTIFRVRKPI